MTCFYYLHTNGDVIKKEYKPEGGSSSVRKVWEFDTSKRESAWLIVIESLAMGANRKRIDELVEKWELTDEDALIFVKRTKKLNLFRDGDRWCATFLDFVNVQESQCGFGETCLDALSELARGRVLK